jgi:two-component system, NarL family, response regulator DesR
VIRVLLAEDQLMFRTAVRRLLELEGDLEVVGEVGRGDELVAAALAARPDVAVVDIELPGQDGLAAAAALRRRLPGCRTLILTMYGRPGFLQRAMEAGVAGFVLKDAPAEALAAASRSNCRAVTVTARPPRRTSRLARSSSMSPRRSTAGGRPSHFVRRSTARTRATSSRGLNGLVT